MRKFGCVIKSPFIVCSWCYIGRLHQGDSECANRQSIKTPTNHEEFLHPVPLVLLAIEREYGSCQRVDSYGQTVDVVLVALE